MPTSRILVTNTLLASFGCVACLDSARPPFAYASYPDRLFADAFIHIGGGVSSPRLFYAEYTAKLDCASALARPAAYLRSSGFDFESHFSTLAGINWPLRNGNDLRPEYDYRSGLGCHLFKVKVLNDPFIGKATDTGWFAVAWSSRELPVRIIPERASDDGLPDGVVMVRAVEDRLVVERRGAVRIGTAQ